MTHFCDQQTQGVCNMGSASRYPSVDLGQALRLAGEGHSEVWGWLNFHPLPSRNLKAPAAHCCPDTNEARPFQWIPWLKRRGFPGSPLRREPSVPVLLGSLAVLTLLACLSSSLTASIYPLTNTLLRQGLFWAHKIHWWTEQKTGVPMELTFYQEEIKSK